MRGRCSLELLHKDLAPSQGQALLPGPGRGQQDLDSRREVVVLQRDCCQPGQVQEGVPAWRLCDLIFFICFVPLKRVGK